MKKNRMKMKIEHGRSYNTYCERDAWMRLAGSILAQAVHDWQRYKMSSYAQLTFTNKAHNLGNQTHMLIHSSKYATPLAELREFFLSDWCVTLCDFCDVDVHWFRKAIGLTERKERNDA